MSGRLRLAAALLALVPVGACGEDGPGPADDVDAGTDAGPELPPEPGDRLFDPTVLHEVRIEVDPGVLEALENDREHRVPCTFTYDGVTLHDVGIRQKGQGTNSGSIYVKPSLSVKFDELVAGQELDGLDKLIFDNAAADPTLMHEPLGYDLYRRAGIAAPRTAHAVITFVGLPQGELVYGVHVVVEAVNKDFLRRNFGRDNDEGNLYEDEARGDFATGPLLVDLKDEVEEGRTREHLVQVAAILTEASDDELVDQLSPHFDLERALQSFAVDVVAGHWDGFWLAAHNYYLYDNPADGRFVLLPHGMDLLFDGGACTGFETSATLLGQRVLTVPALRERLDAAQDEVLGDVWDPSALQEQVDQVTALLDASPHTEPAFVADVERHHTTLDRLAQIFEGTELAFDAPPVCGNGVLERGQVCQMQCDDGNHVDGDGCNALCMPEICGDGIVQPGLGEVCDMTPGCNGTCTGFVVCGDGVVDYPEGCDDGDRRSEDGCSADCALELCGDGVTQPGLGEGCDGEARCRADCSGLIPCGDGVIEWPEYCDDGNHVDDDGCTNDCAARCVNETHGGWSYDFCLARTSYELATAICTHQGAAPAAPRTEDERDWLASASQAYAAEPWWLGIVYDQDWRDAAGAPLRVTGWAAGEPDGSGDCAVMDPTAGGWNDAVCAESHPIVCRR